MWCHFESRKYWDGPKNHPVTLCFVELDLPFTFLASYWCLILFPNLSRTIHGSPVVNEIQGHNAALRDCIGQLTAIESSRARLVSHLREALQDQVLFQDCSSLCRHRTFLVCNSDMVWSPGT